MPRRRGEWCPRCNSRCLTRRRPRTSSGWRCKGVDLPVVVTNASDKLELIPGKLPPHRVAVHPTPKEFVAVAWQSPIVGKVTVVGRIVHAHPACGNGIAWWLEQ